MKQENYTADYSRFFIFSVLFYGTIYKGVEI